MAIEEEEPLITIDDRYKQLSVIGKGAFGIVYKAHDLLTDKIVALKEIESKNFNEREIENLEKLRPHHNIITLIENFTCENDKEYMVFDYMDEDLDALAKRETLTPHDIKHYMRQILTGLAHCDEKKILHRDIKGANILVCKEKNVKIADFGMSREVKDKTNGGSHNHDGTISMDWINQQLTDGVITLPYRPPEILLGSFDYGPEVDVWSLGCVFAKLLNGGALILHGDDKDDQLKKVFELCGKLSEDIWPGVSELPYFDKVENLSHTARCLRERYEHSFDRDALNLLDKMLALDPAKRISAEDALRDAYFNITS